MGREKKEGKKKGKAKEKKASNVRRHRTKRPGREGYLARELSKETDPCLRKLRKAVLTFSLAKAS